MIEKLRKRIVAINVLTACAILFVAVICTFVVGINRINEERESRLSSALSFDFERDNGPFEMDKLYRDIAIIHYDLEEQRIVEMHFGINCNLSPQNVEELVSRALDSERNTGFVNFLVTYMKVTDGNIVKIAFNNYNSSYNGMMQYIWLALGALAMGLVVHFIISLMLARMALRPVEESWKKQKQFVADASHELKTPLSVIMANTDIIASHKEETVESQMKWLENTRSESQRMAGLVADLLFLAKNDDGLKVQMTDVNLSDCVSTIVLGYDAIFYENKKEFSYDIASNVPVVGNEGQIKQLATILLDNANRYSKDNGNIKLKLRANNKHAVITVENDSEPLTEQQLEHLFDRFYTVDPSRNKNIGGNGLGLSIAKIICETHGGTIKAEHTNGKTKFVVVLPLKKK